MILVINTFLTSLVIVVSYNLYRLIKKNNLDIIDYQFKQIEISKGWKKTTHRLVIPMLIIGYAMIFILLGIMWTCF